LQFMIRSGCIKDVKLIFAEDQLLVDVELSEEEVEELISILGEWLEMRRARAGARG